MLPAWTYSYERLTLLSAFGGKSGKALDQPASITLVTHWLGTVLKCSQPHSWGFVRITGRTDSCTVCMLVCVIRALDRYILAL